MKPAATLLPLILGSCLAGPALAQTQAMPREMIIVHPFQWDYRSIARECRDVLGPAGYEGVQISPPSEHISYTGTWWSVYQPVSFENFTTQTGSEKDLKHMIRECRKAGVKVFADAVLNHRASYCKDGCQGMSGAEFDQYRFIYPDMGYDDFHHVKCSDGMVGSRPDTVRNCPLLGMPDVNTERPETRKKLSAYLKKLMSFGVYGFRIDAAKHMPEDSLAAILRDAGNPPVYSEVIIGKHDRIDATKYVLYPSSVVTEFSYSRRIMSDIDQPKKLLRYDAPRAFPLADQQAEVFVANHDNERGSAGTSYLNYTYGPKYYLAQSFMLAFPFGRIRQVYSGYQFREHDDPPPRKVPPCGKGWNCEHREPLIQNAVGFARATRGEKVTSRGSDGKVIWFSRGKKGFYALNAGNTPVTRTFPTTMKDGTYCEILQQKDRCGGQLITVRKGTATMTLPPMSAGAICSYTGRENYCGRKR